MCRLSIAGSAAVACFNRPIRGRTPKLRFDFASKTFAQSAPKVRNSSLTPRPVPPYIPLTNDSGDAADADGVCL